MEPFDCECGRAVVRNRVIVILSHLFPSPRIQGDYWKSIRLQYVRAIAFHGMTLEDALRHLLTDSGFRLPGEAQKIDRLVSSFAECYVADNRDNASCPFTT